jgi:hypothetical protein
MPVSFLRVLQNYICNVRDVDRPRMSKCPRHWEEKGHLYQGDVMRKLASS